MSRSTRYDAVQIRPWPKSLTITRSAASRGRGRAWRSRNASVWGERRVIQEIDLEQLAHVARIDDSAACAWSGGHRCGQRVSLTFGLQVRADQRPRDESIAPREVMISTSAAETGDVIGGREDAAGKDLASLDTGWR